MQFRDWLALLVAAAACYGTAAVGAQFSPGEWYVGLDKPTWTPPSWVFPPVWTILYGTMAVAAWLVWRRRPRAVTAFVLFGLQLALNAAWSWLFFGLERPDLALVDIVVLWILIAATIIAFWRIRAGAAVLMTPYLVWVSFAAALNFAIWRLN